MAFVDFVPQIKYRPWLDGEKIEALFMFQAGTVWASLESIYISCVRDERFSVKLALVEETTVETSHMTGAKEFLIDKGLNYCFYEELNFEEYCPHIVFIQFPYDVSFHTPETLSLQFVRRGTRVIYVPYGIEISDTETARRDHFHSFVVENAWRIYTCCAGIKGEYDKYCHNRDAVRVTGSPKFDAISYKELLPIRKDILRRCRGRKVIVWKMHFPKKINENGAIFQITPYLHEYIYFARSIEKYKDLFFVILAHPKMLHGVVSSDTQGDETLMIQVKELIDILSNIENVYIDESDDYRNTFYHAEAIIMDRSAVMIEAAMLDVPILLMKNQDYSEKMTVSVENVISTFYQGSTCKDMISFIDSIRGGEDKNAIARRNAIADNMPFDDGLCGERIKADIVSGLKEKEHSLKVVLYGTGEIFRYYMEKQHWNQSSKFDLIAVADSDPSKFGLECYGMNIVSPEMLKRMKYDIIVIMTEPHYYEIKKSLVYDFYLDERKIWRLDEFVVAINSNE